VLVLLVNPTLRDKLWAALPDGLKFWVVVYNRPTQGDAALVKHVVADVCGLYRED
jgi:hypothetical protein